MVRLNYVLIKLLGFFFLSKRILTNDTDLLWTRKFQCMLLSIKFLCSLFIWCILTQICPSRDLFQLYTSTSLESEVLLLLFAYMQGIASIIFAKGLLPLKGQPHEPFNLCLSSVKPSWPPSKVFILHFPTSSFTSRSWEKF